MDFLREKHGRPTPEEEKFDVNATTVAVSLKAGTLNHDSGMAFETTPNPEGPGFEPIAKVKMPSNPNP